MVKMGSLMCVFKAFRFYRKLHAGSKNHEKAVVYQREGGRRTCLVLHCQLQPAGLHSHCIYGVCEHVSKKMQAGRRNERKTMKHEIHASGDKEHWLSALQRVCVGMQQGARSLIHITFGWLIVPQTGCDGWSLQRGARWVTTNPPRWARLSRSLSLSLSYSSIG